MWRKCAKSFILQSENIIPLLCESIIGDIIHLIGYYPMNQRPTTTTYRPTNQFDSPANNKPYYHYPQNDHQHQQHQQNEWNYESNHIPHGSGSYSTFNSPISSSASFHTKPQQSNNNYNYNNNYANNIGNGFVDDTGYQITPSPVTNSFNRPKPIPSRPNTNSFDDYDDGYNYGSYQGIDENNQNHLEST